MSAMKLGQGCMQLGAALVGAPLVVLLLAKTAALLWLMPVGGVVFAFGMAALLFSRPTGR